MTELLHHAVGSYDCPGEQNCLTVAGHSFCLSCIKQHARLTVIKSCPICRSDLPKDEAQFRSFEPVQYRVLSQIIYAPISTLTGNCLESPGKAQQKETPNTHLEGDSSAALLRRSKERAGHAAGVQSQPLATAHEVESQVGPSDATKLSSITGPGTNNRRIHRDGTNNLRVTRQDQRRAYEAVTTANISRKAKRCHGDAFSTDRFPSNGKQKKQRFERITQSVDRLNDKNCLRVQSVRLGLDGEDFRYEWSQHSQQWESKDGLGMDMIVPGAMNDLFTQPGADFLSAQVRVDDLLLEFEWVSEESRWEAMKINGKKVHMDIQMMCEAVSMPMNSTRADRI